MIDFNKTRQYTLSIRLSTDGFCFTVHNPQTAHEYAYLPYRIDPQKTLAGNLKSAVEGTEMLKHTYGAVHIILVDTHYTLVPKEYFAEQYEEEFSRFTTSSAAGSIVLHDIVDDEQTVVIFDMEKQLHKYITTRYPKAQIHAAITPLIHFGTERSCAQGKRYCLLHVQKHSIDFMCYENTSPLFVNTFHYRHVTDALYFLLNCWSTLKLSQTEDTLHIAGQPRHTKPIIKEMARFIQHIHTIRPAEEFHSTELARIDEMPFDLQALIACE